MTTSKDCSSIVLLMLQNISPKQLVTSLSSKGQVTIPIEIRKHLRIDTNDKVAFMINPNGTVQVTPAKYPDIKSLSGVAGKLKNPLSWKQTREIAREDYLKEKYGK